MTIASYEEGEPIECHNKLHIILQGRVMYGTASNTPSPPSNDTSLDSDARTTANGDRARTDSEILVQQQQADPHQRWFRMGDAFGEETLTMGGRGQGRVGDTGALTLTPNPCP